MDGIRTPHLINFSWLLKLRWVAVAGQVLTTLAAQALLNLHLPLWPIFAVIGATLASNLVFTLWARRGAGIGEWTVALVMGLDIVLLTLLLYFSGGPLNPFNNLYFVHIALGAVTLGAEWTWGLVGVSLICFGSLFLVPQRDAVLARAMEPLGASQAGSWLAAALAASVIAYFVRRVQTELALREEELATARARQARDERMASLATLSAGAAHELSTPLSTIAVVAKELERGLQRANVSNLLVEDTRLIREQVDRCRAILEQMAAEAGQGFGETHEPITVDALLELCLGSLDRRNGLVVRAEAAMRIRQIHVPPKLLAQALRGIVKNAIDASPPESPVELGVTLAAPKISFEVRDHGHGIPPEILSRIGEPFFTTKEPGRGMGLGIFLARTVAERLGGGLTFESIPEQGTLAVLWVPVPKPATAAGNAGQV